jgi:co-chaperonin GroES (HSP10)
MSEGGIIKPVTSAAKNDKEAIIRAIGPNVDARDFKVGDYCIINDFDVKKIPLDRREFGLCKASSVFATYEHI